MLHFSTGLHHRTDSGHSSHHAGDAIRGVTMILAEAIRHHWLSVGAVAVALWVATDLGTNVVLVAPLLAVLAFLVNSVLDPSGPEAFEATDELG